MGPYHENGGLGHLIPSITGSTAVQVVRRNRADLAEINRLDRQGGDALSVQNPNPKGGGEGNALFSPHTHTPPNTQHSNHNTK